MQAQAAVETVTWSLPMSAMTWSKNSMQAQAAVETLRHLVIVFVFERK